MDDASEPRCSRRRFLGTLASGAFHGWGGMQACLWAAAIALAIAWAVTLVLPRDAAQEAA